MKDVRPVHRHFSARKKRVRAVLRNEYFAAVAVHEFPKVMHFAFKTVIFGEFEIVYRYDLLDV